jgi:hypothetical protein
MFGSMKKLVSVVLCGGLEMQTMVSMIYHDFHTLPLRKLVKSHPMLRQESSSMPEKGTSKTVDDSMGRNGAVVEASTPADDVQGDQ